MNEAKIPENGKSLSGIDIFLFSNGQQYSPPRKYHLRSEDLQQWDTTLNSLAQLQYGSLHSIIDFHTLDGRKIEGPLELRNGSMYVAVEPPDIFIQSGYEKYTMKALRSWEKRQAKKTSRNKIDEVNNVNDSILHNETNSINKHCILESITSSLQSNSKRKTSSPNKSLRKKEFLNAIIAPHTIARNTKALKKFPFPNKNESVKRREVLFKKNTRTTPSIITNTKDVMGEVALTKPKINTDDHQLEEALPIPTKRTSNEKRNFALTKGLSYNDKNNIVDINKVTNADKESSEMVPTMKSEPMKSNDQLKDTILTDLKIGDVISQNEVFASAKVINSNNEEEVVEKNKLDLSMIADVYVNKNPENEITTLLTNVSLSKIERDINSKTKKPLIDNETMEDYIDSTNFSKNENCNDVIGRDMSCHNSQKGKSDVTVLKSVPENSPDIDNIMSDKTKDQCVMVINKADTLTLKLNIEIRNTEGHVNTKYHKGYLNSLNTKTDRESQVEIDVCLCQTSIIVNEQDVVMCTNDKNVNGHHGLTVKTNPVHEEKQSCNRKDHKENKEPEYPTQNSVLNKEITESNDSKFSSQPADVLDTSKPSICKEFHTIENETGNCKEFGPNEQSIENENPDLANQHIVICETDKASDVPEPDYVFDKSVAEKCRMYENKCHSPDNKPNAVSLLNPTRNHVTEASTQTEWCNVMLEARCGDNGRYTFHLPPLHVLKQYKIQ